MVFISNPMLQGALLSPSKYNQLLSGNKGRQHHSHTLIKCKMSHSGKEEHNTHGKISAKV
jgi:hypothetical protein